MPAAPERRRPGNKLEYGKVESQERFQLSHTPGGYCDGQLINSPVP